MLPELSIERVFRRELDSLPLPPDDTWVPSPKAQRLHLLGAVVAATAVVLLIGTALAVREAADAAAAARRGVVTTPQPLALGSQVRPTCADGRCVSAVPIVIRNPALGYNLWIPGDWRQTKVPAPASQGGLVDRSLFTARYPQDEEAAIAAANGVPAWDFLVEVWDRQGRSALDFARTGTCASQAISRAATCEVSTQTLRGQPTVVTTVSLLGGGYTKSYYVERGERLLILRYVIDPAVDRPSHVTEQTLEQIVRMIGLV